MYELRTEKRHVHMYPTDRDVRKTVVTRYYQIRVQETHKNCHETLLDGVSEGTLDTKTGPGPLLLVESSLTTSVQVQDNGFRVECILWAPLRTVPPTCPLTPGTHKGGLRRPRETVGTRLGPPPGGPLTGIRLRRRQPPTQDVEAVGRPTTVPRRRRTPSSPKGHGHDLQLLLPVEVVRGLVGFLSTSPVRSVRPRPTE